MLTGKGIEESLRLREQTEGYEGKPITPPKNPTATIRLHYDEDNSQANFGFELEQDHTFTIVSIDGFDICWFEQLNSGLCLNTMMPGERLSSPDEALLSSALIFTTACTKGLSWEKTPSECNHQFNGLARGYAIASIRINRVGPYLRKYLLDVKVFDESLFTPTGLPIWGYGNRSISNTGSPEDLFIFGAELVDEYLDWLWQKHQLREEWAQTRGLNPDDEI